MLEFVAILIIVLLPSLIIVHFKLHWLSLGLSMLGLAALGIGLFGIPGAAFLEPTETLLTRLGANAMPADSVWPTTILITLLLPLALVPSWLITCSFFRRTGFWAQVLRFAALFFVGTCLISIATYLVLF